MKYLPGYPDLFISPITGKILNYKMLPDLEKSYIWVGRFDGTALPKPDLIDLKLEIIDLRYSINFFENLPKNKIFIGNKYNKTVYADSFSIENLPNLTFKKTWVGDENNRPVESSFSPSPSNAYYILQQSNPSLPNAQALNSLPNGILKHVSGVVEIAVAGIDYATKEQLDVAVQRAEAAASSAETSSSAAAASALEATAAAAEATAAAVAASFSAIEAASSAASAFISFIEASISAIAAGISAASASSSASSASNSAQEAEDAKNSILGVLGAPFILQYPNTQMPNAQALSNILNGYLVNNSGVLISRSITSASNSRILIQNPNGISGNTIFDLAQTGVVAGTYNNVSVDIYGRITFASNASYGTGTVTSVGIITPNGSGIYVTNSPIVSSGNIELSLSSSLESINLLTGIGFLVRNSSGIYLNRQITQGTGISVTNGDGISGNTLISLSSSGTQAGTYTFPSTLSVDFYGRITNILSGGSDTQGSSVGNFFIAQAGKSSVSGYYNIGIGRGALGAISSGYGNIGIGVSSGGVTSGNDNLSIGIGCLGYGYTSSRCIAIGNSSFRGGSSGFSGDNNIGVGVNTGYSFTSYNSCTFIGYFADSSVSGLTNSGAFGANARVGSSNTIKLGDINSKVAIGNTTIANTALTVIGGHTNKRTAIASNYTVLLEDYIIGVTNTSSPRTITFPVASSSNIGQVYVVKDESGTASTNNIICIVSGGGLIDGQSSFSINQNYGFRQFYSSGSQWRKL